MPTLFFHEIEPSYIGWIAEFDTYQSNLLNNAESGRCTITGKLDGFIKDNTKGATKVALLVAGQKFVIDLGPHPENFLIKMTNPNGVGLC